ncbi:endonuclease VII [Microbacterium phage FuzzBuster]|uniref:Endonuclease VII n=1 Tax=Microbacterium phage FuzzBuster TaxID=2590935 RepID=A0A516KV32_9CAUD|nr:endonuclease VII [Microbacterium phage FuzzBuster]
MAAQKCKECERRPKMAGRHRCATCFLRHLPIGDQVAAARLRLAMVPPELRVKRSKKIEALAPSGTSFCAGCQSFRDLADFAKGATMCKACKSAKTHAASIEKTYGLTPEQYDELLKRQGGKCAICRAKPKTKRLAVDHDHKTGAVLGLLCSRCNHDLKGSAWDSLAMATALWHYMNTPPATGHWIAPENAPQLMPVESAVRRSDGLDPEMAIVTGKPQKRSGAASGAAEEAECVRLHYLPVGWVPVEGKIGVYYVEDTPGTDAPF